MEFAAGVLALIRWDLSFTEYTGEFCGLAASTELHDAPILHLFWLGANYHCPMDLPDITGLCWREGIYRCLESFRSRVKTSPRVSQLAPPSSSSSQLAPSSSPWPPLVPSSSSLPPLVPSSSPWPPLVLSSSPSAFPERPRESAVPECPPGSNPPNKFFLGGLPTMAHGDPPGPPKSTDDPPWPPDPPGHLSPRIYHGGLKARTHRDEYRRALFASVFQRVFCVHTQAIFADDVPSEHANSFPNIRWHLM